MTCSHFSFIIPADRPNSPCRRASLSKVPCYQENDRIVVSKKRVSPRLGPGPENVGLGIGWSAPSEIGIPQNRRYKVDCVKIPHQHNNFVEVIAFGGMWKGPMCSPEAAMIYSIEQIYRRVMYGILQQYLLDNAPYDTNPISSLTTGRSVEISVQ